MRAGFSCHLPLRLLTSPRRWRTSLATLSTLVLMAQVAYAQSPWERAANNLAISFTGTLARSLSLVAMVVGGLMFMFGEHGANNRLAGIVFGGGIALFATQFMAWLF